MTRNSPNPLNPDQIHRFERTTTEAEDPIRTLTGHFLLRTGLRNTEFNHMRPGWLSKDNGKVLIEIPEEEECVSGVGPTGTGNEKQVNLSNRGEPCAKCRNKSHRDYNRWKVSTPAAIRTIQIASDQQPLVNLLDWWQQGFDFIPLSHQGVNYHLRLLAEEAGLDRNVTAQDLRYTHAMNLGKKGYTAPEIMVRLGYSSLEPARQFTADSE